MGKAAACKLYFVVTPKESADGRPLLWSTPALRLALQKRRKMSVTEILYRDALGLDPSNKRRGNRPAFCYGRRRIPSRPEIVEK
jgi:hypothetical protein